MNAEAEAVTKSQIDTARYNVEALADAGELVIVEPTRKGAATRYSLPQTTSETLAFEYTDSEVDSEV
jgi:hypothetical protein